MPSKRLETFGATILNYHMISEFMDDANRVRVRDGRIHAYRPQIVAPASFADSILEGFGVEAEKYAKWLRDNVTNLRILEYGFKIKKEEFSESVITDKVETVTERVRRDVRETGDPFSAVVLGVDEPWEVCLVKLMAQVVQRSAERNATEIVHEEVETAFRDAAGDHSHMKDLADTLKQYGLFEKYQDRFFSLLRTSRR
jgi:hypothetical protein